MTHTLIIDKKFLETLGSHSLEGKIFDLCNGIPKDILELQFLESSQSWRDENGGPNEIIINEFVPFCLVESVLNLIRMGVKLQISTQTTNNPNL